jgi:hypothetical protein
MFKQLGLSFLALGMTAHVALAAPKDISRIEALVEFAEAGVADPTDDFEARYIDKLAATILEIAYQRAAHGGYAEVVDWDAPELTIKARSRVERDVRAGTSADTRVDRRDKFMDALIEATAASTGDEVVASYLGLPAPGKLVKYKKYKGTPSFQKQMSITSKGTGGLRLEAEGFALAAEHGGAGQGNGIIDAGEWLSVNFAVVNVSDEPYFSTSAWLRSKSECAYVAGTRENEMPELPRMEKQEEEEAVTSKGKKKSTKKPAVAPAASEPGLVGKILGMIPFMGDGAAPAVPAVPAVAAAPKLPAPPLAKDKRVIGQFTSWVYLSDTCDDNQRVQLHVFAKDTHRTGTKNAETLGLALDVRNRAKAKVINYMLDADRPGFSDATDVTALGAGNLVEFSHGLQVNKTELREAYQGWGISRFHKPMVDDADYRDGERMLGISSGKLRPGDDYDVRMNGFDRFQESADNVAASRGWFRSADGRVILATDVAVLYESPDPTVTTVVEQPDPESDCDDCLDNDGDELIDCDDSDCAESKACEEPNKPVDIEQVIGLFTDSAEIIATPITPQPGNLLAVTHSYELTFDDDTFRKRYQCFVEGLTLEECLAPDCPDCPKLEEEEEEEPEVIVSKGVDAIAYTYRHYFEAPLDWAPQASPYPPLRIYAGADLAQSTILDSGLDQMHLRLRGGLDYGVKSMRNRLRLSAVGGVALPTYPWALSDSDLYFETLGQSGYIEAYGTIGLRFYVLRIADMLSFAPGVHGGLDLRSVGNIYVDTDNDGEPDVIDSTVGINPYAEASLLVHLELGETWGLYGEAAYRILANDIYADGLADGATRVGFSTPITFGAGLTYSMW